MGIKSILGSLTRSGKSIGKPSPVTGEEAIDQAARQLVDRVQSGKASHETVHEAVEELRSGFERDNVTTSTDRPRMVKNEEAALEEFFRDVLKHATHRVLPQLRKFDELVEDRKRDISDLLKNGSDEGELQKFFNPDPVVTTSDSMKWEENFHLYLISVERVLTFFESSIEKEEEALGLDGVEFQKIVGDLLGMVEERKEALDAIWENLESADYGKALENYRKLVGLVEKEEHGELGELEKRFGEGADMRELRTPTKSPTSSWVKREG